MYFFAIHRKRFACLGGWQKVVDAVFNEKIAKFPFLLGPAHLSWSHN